MHALLFDLDGTLVDTVYTHVLAWQCALGEVGVAVDGYRLHRHVGSSGDLIVRYAQREAGRQLSAEQAQTVHRRHGELFRQMMPRPRPLPGAVEVFRTLRFVCVPKHTSWLNQIEIWFSILVRRVLKRGNFSSEADLREKILAFIDYFNRTLAKPFKWTF